MRIYNMVIQILLILLGHLGEHLVQLVLHTLTLDDAVCSLVDFALQVGNILHGNVSVGICLAGSSSIISCLAVLVHVVDTLLDETCLGMLLTVKYI